MLRKVVAVLILAVVGWLIVLPFLINWDGYESQINHRIELLTGHKPEITGGIKVDFFPLPRVRVEDIIIKGVGDAAAPAFLEVPAMEARPSLLSLLAGRLEVDQIYLINPMVRFIRNGQGKWNFLAAQDWQDRVSSGTIFNDVQLVNGQILYLDQTNGVMHLFDSVNGRLKLSTLLGPFKVEGSLKKDRNTYEISATIDKLIAGKDIDADIAVKGSGMECKVEGSVTNTNKEWQFKGNGSLKGDDLSQYFLVFKHTLDSGIKKIKLKQTKQKDLADKPATEPVPFTITANIAAKLNALDLSNIEMKSDALSGKGSFSGQWKQLINTETSFNFESLDLDELLGQNIDYKEWLKGFMISLPRELKGLVDITIKEVTLNKDKINDVEFQADIVNGEIGVFPLTLTLPGNNLVTITGMISRNEIRPEFAGSAEVKGKDLVEFFDFLNIRPEWMADNSFKDFTAKSEFRFVPHFLKFSDMTVTSGPSVMNGSVSFKYGNKVKVITDLTLDKFNFDQFGLQVRGAKWLKSVGEQMVFDQQPAYLTTIQTMPIINDNHIVLHDAVWNGENIAQLETDLSLSPGNAYLGQFSLQSDKTDIGMNGYLNAIGLSHKFHFAVEGKKFNWGTFYTIAPQTPDEIKKGHTYVDVTKAWSNRQLLMGGLSRLAGDAVGKIDEVTVHNAVIRNFDANLLFGSGLQIKNFSGEANDGKFNIVANALIQTRPLIASGVMVLERMQLSPMMSWLFHYPQFDGYITLSSAYKMQGGSLYDLVRSLSGNTIFALRNITLDGISVNDFISNFGSIDTLKELETRKQTMLSTGQSSLNGIDGKGTLANGTLTLSELKYDMLPLAKGVGIGVFDLNSWMVNFASQIVFLGANNQSLRLVIRSKGLANALQTSLSTTEIDNYIKAKRTQQFLDKETPLSPETQPSQPTTSPAAPANTETPPVLPPTLPAR